MAESYTTVWVFHARLFHSFHTWQHMQGVVGSSTNHFIANFLENLPVKNFLKSAKVWQSYWLYCHEFGASLFIGTRCIKRRASVGSILENPAAICELKREAVRTAAAAEAGVLHRLNPALIDTDELWLWTLTAAAGLEDAKLSSRLRSLIDGDGRLTDESVACHVRQCSCANNQLYANCFRV